MKRPALLLTVLLCCAVAASSDAPKRPGILGIAYVKILVSDETTAADFYSLALESAPPAKLNVNGSQPCTWCEHRPMNIRKQKQHVGPVKLEVTSDRRVTNRLAEVAFRTNDVKKLRAFLLSKGLSPGELGKCADDPCFNLNDPENHCLIFVASPAEPRIIHAGFIVHDRTATEHFYKDILGFRPYWHGGMKDDQTDWVSMQVPDGTDWLEFMVNVEPDADQRLRGIMNHIAIGVTDIHAAQKKLQENGVKLTEQPQIGRDGKWQLNLYDPDLTRIEFMEFTPVQKPCCSEYTGPHPKP